MSEEESGSGRGVGDDLAEAVASCSESANDLPCDSDFAYFSTFPAYKDGASQQGKRILALLGRVMEYQGHSKLSKQLNKSLATAEEQLEAVIDLADNHLEAVDHIIDLEKGSSHTTNTQQFVGKNEWSGKGKKPTDFKTFGPNSALLRPQLHFEDKIDNSNTLFIPRRYRQQDNSVSQSSLTQSPQISAALASHIGVLGVTPQKKKDKSVSFPHPYEIAIRALEPDLTVPKAPTNYKPLADTPCTWVDSVELLDALVSDLEKVSEFAVDLENHSYRSFQGFLCLMQISTRTQDYLIDTLTLRNQMHRLEGVFVNPEIVKVLHGADSDIKWLQRDFDLYIVNMFDTGQAARVLEMQSFGLQFLLKHFCNVDVDKKYQLADWRVRPIPWEMLKYAREDTHYLLYVYDRLRIQLSEKGNSEQNLLLAALHRSQDLCLLRYEKDVVDEASHTELYKRHNKLLSPQQLRVFAALFSWRDSVAREEDESLGYVMSTGLLFLISEKMPLTTPELFALCKPHPPAIIRQRGDELVALISTAKQAEPFALDEPETRTEATTAKADAAAAPPAPNSILSSSPVHTKGQLYSAAGWVELSGSETKKTTTDTHDTTSDMLGTKRSHWQVTVGPSAPGSTAASSSLFGMSSDSEDDQEDEEETQHMKTAQLIRESFADSGVFALLTEEQENKGQDEDEDDEDDENLEEANRLAHNVAVSVAAAAVSTPSPDIAERERMRKAQSPAVSFSPVQFNTEFATPQQQPSSQPKAASSEFATPQQPPSSLTKGTPQSEASDGTPLEKGLPQSLAEIYQLSNKNRKRNKQKKKQLREGSRVDPSPAFEVEAGSPAEEDDGLRKRRKSDLVTDKSEVVEDTVDFLKRVGWIKPEAAASSPSKTGTAATKGSAKPDFKPFDYEAAAAAAAVAGEAQETAIPVYDGTAGLAGPTANKPRSRVRTKAGQRSMTFSNGGRGGGRGGGASSTGGHSQQHWPKR